MDWGQFEWNGDNRIRLWTIGTDLGLSTCIQTLTFVTTFVRKHCRNKLILKTATKAASGTIEFELRGTQKWAITYR